MNVLIDTCVWIAFFSGRPIPTLEKALQEGLAILSPIVIAELLSGTKNKKEITMLQNLIVELPIHPTPLNHWMSLGLLRQSLAKKGFQCSIPDTHLIQCALEANAVLFSYDKIFSKVAKKAGIKVWDESY